jgi:hypothetical protein
MCVCARACVRVCLRARVSARVCACVRAGGRAGVHVLACAWMRASFVQVQIWTPLGREWLASPAFASRAMQFLVRLDLAPTAYVHAQDQAAFPLAMASTNNVQDLVASLRRSGDLF